MATKTPSKLTAKWFFILVSIAVLYLFWKIIEPFALVLIMAGVAAIIFAPVDRWLQQFIKYPKISGLLVVVGVFLLILLPLIGLGFIIVQQASDVVVTVIDNDGLNQAFDLSALPLFDRLPAPVQDWAAELNIATFGLQAAGWIAQNITVVFAQATRFVFHTVIFFISFFYLLVDRRKLHKAALELSPFNDKLDAQIIARIKSTVRGVVFGAMIIAVVQGFLAGIGMTIFGVPGAALWGALVVIAAQIPMVGAAIIMIPAVVFLWVTGSTGAAIGLTVWAVVAVGLVDNLLSPYLVSGKTKMHGLLILLAILGGIQLFGPIGFIVGPTILAGLMVLVDLYRQGVLEKYAKVV